MKTTKKEERITTFVCFDIETTGLNPMVDKIIEIGAMKVKDGKIIDRFSQLINPNMKLSATIVNLTGITDSMLKYAEQEHVVVKNFLSFVEDNVIIGHNIQFDYSFIKLAAGRLHLPFEKKGIDTLYLCKKLHSELKSKSLGNMCKHYNIINEHAHRAYDDVKATTMLYVNLINKFYEEQPEVFRPKLLNYKMKKVQTITNKQKNYLIDLLKYHKIEYIQPIESLTQSEASKWIDKIILEKGRIN
jgi:DNA polymerase-3 subunit alpha (Gram-positive type)